MTSDTTAQPQSKQWESPVKKKNQRELDKKREATLASKRAKLPYERATTGDRAVTEMQKVLQRFGCQSFGTMMDWERKLLVVQFKYRNQSILIEASTAGYAAAWLRAHPYAPSSTSRRTPRRRRTRTLVEHEREAERVASLAVYSICRDWIKGQVTAVECGILSFEGAFLGQILLGGGRTVLAHMRDNQLLPPGDDAGGET